MRMMILAPRLLLLFSLLLAACGGGDAAAPENLSTEEVTEVIGSGEARATLAAAPTVDFAATDAFAAASTPPPDLFESFSVEITGAAQLVLSSGLAEVAFTPAVPPNFPAVYELLITDEGLQNYVSITFPGVVEAATYNFGTNFIPGDGAAQAQVVIVGANGQAVYAEATQGTLALRSISQGAVTGDFTFTISRTLEGGVVETLSLYGIFADVPVVR